MKGTIALRPLGYLSPNSRRYAACFLTAHWMHAALDTTKNAPAAPRQRMAAGAAGRTRTDPVPAHGEDGEPREEVEEVVRERDEVKAVPARDAARRRALRAQVAQGQVRVQVRGLRPLYKATVSAGVHERGEGRRTVQKATQAQRKRGSLRMEPRRALSENHGE